MKSYIKFKNVIPALMDMLKCKNISPDVYLLHLSMLKNILCKFYISSKI